MKTKRFNDTLALILVLAIVGLWILDPVLKAQLGQGLPDQVVVASITILVLVVQFYYRKARDETNSSG